MRIHITGALLMLALGADHGMAQVSRDSSRARAIEAVPLGTHIKLVAAGHEYFGALTARDQLDLTLDRFGDRFTVPRMEVQALWTAGGRATQDGFWTGAVIGAIPGGILGFLAGGLLCDHDCVANMAYGTVLGAGAGGLALGAVGALIGSTMASWQKRFP